jgi:hypothetical protein
LLFAHPRVISAARVNFKALKGLLATIRFLDPPLHEFLPHEDAAQRDREDDRLLRGYQRIPHPPKAPAFIVLHVCRRKSDFRGGKLRLLFDFCVA